MKRQTIVAISDVQAPYQDSRALANIINFIGEYRPTRVVQVGDFLDAPQPSRWSKGMAGEYEPTLQRDVDECKSILARIRAVYDGPLTIKRGNHDERIETYVSRYAPALRSIRALRLEELLGLGELEVGYERGIFDLAPGWVCAHGDEGKYRNDSGGTALALAEQLGKSVVCGHTHKLAVKHRHDSYAGRVTRRLYGFEVGNVMNLKKAHYLKAGSANWQQGFGILYVDGSTVTPSPIYIQGDGSFLVEGRQYGGKAA